MKVWVQGVFSALIFIWWLVLVSAWTWGVWTHPGSPVQDQLVHLIPADPCLWHFLLALQSRIPKVDSGSRKEGKSRNFQAFLCRPLVLCLAHFWASWTCLTRPWGAAPSRDKKSVSHLIVFHSGVSGTSKSFFFSLDTCARFICCNFSST